MNRFTTEITVPNKDFFLAPVVSFGRELASRAGFPLKEVSAIETALREACQNVVTHAFSPEEDAIYDVVFDVGKNDLTLIVKDKGLPYQPIGTRDLAAKVKDGQYQGLFLIKQAMDKVKFVNLGPEGKEIHMTKYLPAKRVYELFSQEDLAAYSTEEAAAVDRKVHRFRLLEPSDAIELSRTIYRVYGYTYSVRDYVYYPDRLAENLYNGNLTSLVAENQGGEVMAHAGLLAPEERSSIGEIGLGLVIPKFRGSNLLKRMTDELLTVARDRGLKGLYVESVTNHVLSQKSANRDGFRDCAFCFGALPEDFTMKMDGGTLSQRGTLVVSYQPLEKNPNQNAFLPSHHAPMIRKIYENLGVERNFNGLPTYYERRKISRFIVKTYPQMQSAWIRVLNYGKDTFEVIRDRLRELQRDRMEAVILDLPLESTQTVAMCRIFEDMGCFFSGIIPDHLDGDVIRLTYIGNVHFDFDRVQLYSDFGKELRDYCRDAFLKNEKRV